MDIRIFILFVILWNMMSFVIFYLKFPMYYVLSRLADTSIGDTNDKVCQMIGYWNKVWTMGWKVDSHIVSSTETPPVSSRILEDVSRFPENIGFRRGECQKWRQAYCAFEVVCDQNMNHATHFLLFVLMTLLMQRMEAVLVLMRGMAWMMSPKKSMGPMKLQDNTTTKSYQSSIFWSVHSKGWEHALDPENIILKIIWLVSSFEEAHHSVIIVKSDGQEHATFLTELGQFQNKAVTFHSHHIWNIATVENTPCKWHQK